VAALAQLVDDGAFLAAADVDAPFDRTWISFPHAHTSRDPGPFYLVWPQDHSRRDDHPWPYGITAMRLGSVRAVLGPAVPKSARFQEGFDLFRRNCIMCHSLNGRGGTIGIELNDPRNVFEYWQSDKLPEFVLRPESFRRNSKMPAFEQLGNESISAILAYIKHMKDHKVTQAP
jgi:mono/diheme cytochrome c family protein